MHGYGDYGIAPWETVEEMDEEIVQYWKWCGRKWRSVHGYGVAPWETVQEWCALQRLYRAGFWPFGPA